MLCGHSTDALTDLISVHLQLTGETCIRPLLNDEPFFQYYILSCLVREWVVSWKSMVSILFNKTTVLCLRTLLSGMLKGHAL